MSLQNFHQVVSHSSPGSEELHHHTQEKLSELYIRYLASEVFCPTEQKSGVRTTPASVFFFFFFFMYCLRVLILEAAAFLFLLPIELFSTIFHWIMGCRISYPEPLMVWPKYCNFFYFL